MNSKTLKKLRKTVRLMFPSLTSRHLEKTYVARVVPVFGALNFDGTQRTVTVAWPRPAKNSAKTQRAVYRQAKADLRQARLKP